VFDQLLKLGAIAPGAGDFFFEQLFASCGGEALALAVEVLILGSMAQRSQEVPTESPSAN
jgi:hypothetical protein